MQHSTQSENISIVRYRKLVAIAEDDPARDGFGTKYCCGCWPKKNKTTASIDS